MHSGLLTIIRRFLIHAKPWQQVLVCVSLVVAGIVLVAAGIFFGAVMSIFGLLFGWQILSTHRANRDLEAERDVERSDFA